MPGMGTNGSLWECKAGTAGQAGLAGQAGQARQAATPQLAGILPARLSPANSSQSNSSQTSIGNPSPGQPSSIPSQPRPSHGFRPAIVSESMAGRFRNPGDVVSESNFPGFRSQFRNPPLSFGIQFRNQSSTILEHGIPTWDH